MDIWKREKTNNSSWRPQQEWRLKGVTLILFDGARHAGVKQSTRVNCISITEFDVFP